MDQNRKEEIAIAIMKKALHTAHVVSLWHHLKGNGATIEKETLQRNIAQLKKGHVTPVHLGNIALIWLTQIYIPRELGFTEESKHVVEKLARDGGLDVTETLDFFVEILLQEVLAIYQAPRRLCVTA